MTNANQAIETLRKQASQDAVLHDVLLMFGARERARSQVSVRGLSLAMRAAGFKHNEDKYRQVIKLLGSLGFGSVETDRKGKVRVLKNITVRLNSIGGAVHEKASLESFRPRNRYQSIELPAISPPLNRRATDRITDLATITITLPLNGKNIKLEVPRNLSPEEIAGLLSRFQEKKEIA